MVANSRDVAATFGKRHADVLRAIDNLIADAPACQRNFAFTSETVVMPKGGTREIRVCEMDRTGFSLLAMGFTGAIALRFKLDYVAAFDAMEDRLRAQPDPVAALDDPMALRGLLLSYSEKVVTLEQRNAELTPKAAALDRFDKLDGVVTLTEAAKLLGRPRGRFIKELLSAGWLYRRAGARQLLGFTERENAGLLDHKRTVVESRDGGERIALQVVLTPKGLAKLGERYAAQTGELFS